MKFPRWRLVAKRPRRKRPRVSKANTKLKIRDLYAPSLYGRYEIVIKMSNQVTSEDDIFIRETLYDMIPGRFKITTWKKWSPNKGEEGNVRNIYLKKESDLFAVQFAFKEKIWRVMRVVNVQKPQEPIEKEVELWEKQRLIIVNSFFKLYSMLHGAS